MSVPSIPAAVIARQHEASDPSVSAWVSANAGAGKTHVLAQRVIRLLLDGTDPAKILCLTFTKAAAANMANRVFDDAGEMDRARRRRARRGDPQDRREQAGRARRSHGRASCSRRRWKRRAASRCRPSTPSARGCCSSFRSRPMSRRASGCWKRPQQQQMLEQTAQQVLLRRRREPDSAPGRALATAITAASDMTFQRASCAKRSASATRSRHGSSVPAASTPRGGALARARHRRRTTRSRASTRNSSTARYPAGQWPDLIAALIAGLQDRPGAGRAPASAAAARGANARDLSVDLLHRQNLSPAKTSSPRRFATKHPDWRSG